MRGKRKVELNEVWLDGFLMWSFVKEPQGFAWVVKGGSGLLYETVIGNWNELMKDWMFVFGKVPRDREKGKVKQFIS